MSSFEVPISVCDSLMRSQKKFWWKPKEKDGKFLAWRAWDKLCASKATGGQGFKVPSITIMLYFLISLDGHLQAGQPLVGTMAANIQTQAQK